MGRGRQKAKQTKVARKLKYFSPDTDLSALQRELASGHGDSGADPYSKYAEDADGDTDEPDQDAWSHTRSGH
ncbi:MAG: DUF3073 domain-containing protein [Actinomyces sp.]|nr:DUF3073 domain-containing protein [Actinomyces sp.]MDN6429971.1 DUF3073 domain-containing protein [Propionibacterium sp.]MDN6566520.1 DUF3073 domain-containing protein [Actinomyces sp.]MDN6795235.1 DUF3073 domain-containing protein [Propionibacterium sp.]